MIFPFLALSFWEPEDDNMMTKKVVVQWVGLIGDLFIRALKAIVLPLVFFNVMLSVVDMMAAQRASVVGLKTIVLYTFTTFVASVIGLISVLGFKSTFTQGAFEEVMPPFVSFQCSAEDTFITEMDDGSLMCSMDAEEEDSMFVIDDVSGYFVQTSGAFAQLSMSDTLYDGVFMKLITDNITSAFKDGNFASVVIFAIVAGCALGRVLYTTMNGDAERSTLVMFIRELNDVLLKMINWVILITPFAVLSLIAQAVGSQSDLSGAFKNVGYLIISLLSGFAAHFIIVDVLLLGIVTRKNPFAYLSHIVPAQMTALACASSAATLPVTMRCVKASGMVPDTVRNFVCPLGATINMDGSGKVLFFLYLYHDLTICLASIAAIYFPGACIWLAVLNGINPNFGQFILLIILSTIGSAGAAPVPSSGLVLVITAYNTVFGKVGTPDGFEFIVAIDWFVDRVITALNITGDTVVSRVIASTTDLSDDTTRSDSSTDEGVPASSDGETPPAPLAPREVRNSEIEQYI